ncbi:MAG: NAD(P)/FAD-dependent oxidoreductase [Actinomycetota bacterium]
MSDHDVIVIGAGLGGLSTAALCAKHGLDTLVIEQSDIIGGCCSTFEADGYRFDVGASIVEVVQPLDALFELMGRRRADYMELIPCDPIYSFITEDGRRFSYPTDIDACTQVIERIAPGDLQGWDRFCGTGLAMIEGMMDAVMLSPLNTFGDAIRIVLDNPRILKFAPTFLRSHQGVVRSFYKDPVMLQSVAFQSYFAGAPPELGSGVFGYIALSEHLGIYYPRGGMIAIPNGILGAGREHGLEVRTGTKVEKILIEDGKACGVKLEDESVVTARVVVSNLNAQVTYLKLVGPDRLPRWAVRGIASYENSMPCPMVYVGLDREPELEAHHTVVTSSLESMNDIWNNYYRLNLIPDTAMSLVCWPTEADPTLAPEGKHILNFLCNAPAPYAPLGDNWDRLKPWYEEQAIRELEKYVLPDVRDHIEYIQVSTPLDFERRLLHPRGGIYGLFSDMTSLAMFRPRSRSKAVKNLYLTGSSTHLGGGVPTTIASGIVTSRYVIQDHG